MSAKKTLCQIVPGNPAKSPTGKTKIWRVMDPREEYEIGQIKWYGAWRCYAFEPFAYTIYEKDCLRFIADFCEAESTKARKLFAKRAAKTRVLRYRK